MVAHELDPFVLVQRAHEGNWLVTPNFDSLETALLYRWFSWPAIHRPIDGQKAASWLTLFDSSVLGDFCQLTSVIRRARWPFFPRQLTHLYLDIPLKTPPPGVSVPFMAFRNSDAKWKDQFYDSEYETSCLYNFMRDWGSLSIKSEKNVNIAEQTPSGPAWPYR